MDQSLSSYRVFYEVAKAGNLSRAAKALSLSQPAVSKAIGKLETNLHTQLFIRESRGVSLTQQGSLLYRHVSSAFQSLENGELELRRHKQLELGLVRLGASTTLCKYVLLPYLKAFLVRYPHIEINIQNQSSSLTMEMLEQGQLDIGLVDRNVVKAGYRFIPVCEIHDGFVCTPSYLARLRIREGHEDIDPFSCGTVLLPDKTNISGRLAADYLLNQEISPRRTIVGGTMDLLIEFARVGIGIASAVTDFVTDDLEAGRLISLPLPAPMPPRNVGLVFPDIRLSSAVQSFLDFASVPDR